MFYMSFLWILPNAFLFRERSSFIHSASTWATLSRRRTHLGCASQLLSGHYKHITAKLFIHTYIHTYIYIWYIYIDIIIWDTVYPGFTNLGEQRANKSPLPSGLSPKVTVESFHKVSWLRMCRGSHVAFGCKKCSISMAISGTDSLEVPTIYKAYVRPM